jgi:hypothetical protein
LQQATKWEHARWTFLHSQQKIFVLQFVVVVVFQETEVKGCSRVAQTHTRVKTTSQFIENTKKIHLKAGKSSQQKLTDL